MGSRVVLVEYNAPRVIVAARVLLALASLAVLSGCGATNAPGDDRAPTVGSANTAERCPEGRGACADAKPNGEPVPDVVGMPVLAACRELVPSGYTGAVVGEVGNPRSGPSRVVAQEPEAGREGDEGGLVRLTVSEPYPARVLEQNPECLDRTELGPGGKPNGPT